MTKAKEALEYIKDQGLEYPNKPFNTIIKALELLDKVERGGDMKWDTFVPSLPIPKRIMDNYILIKKDSE